MSFPTAVLTLTTLFFFVKERRDKLAPVLAALATASRSQPLLSLTKKKSVVSVKTAVGKDREHGFSTRVFSLRAKRGRSSCSTHAVDSLLVAFDAMQALPRGDVRRNIT